MALPSFAQLRHPALPTSMYNMAPPEPYHETLPGPAGIAPHIINCMNWIQALYRKLGTIEHTVPDNAPEGTVPTPSFVADLTERDPNNQVVQLQDYLEEHFNYTPAPPTIGFREMSKRIYSFLVSTPPFDLVVWPTCADMQRKRQGPQPIDPDGPYIYRGPEEWKLDEFLPIVESYLGM